MSRAPILVALVLAAASTLVVGCEEKPAPAGTATLPIGRKDLPTPDQVVEDGEHVMTSAGVKKAVLRAEQLYFYDQTSTVIGDTIQVDFYNPQGEFLSMLTARTGTINQATQAMTATGNVFVRGTDSTIQTEELHYDPEKDRIWSDVPTTINQRGNVIRGKGVESDPALKEIKIRGGSAVLRSEPRLGPEPRPDTAAQRNDGGT